MKQANIKEQHTIRASRLISCVTALGIAFTVALPVAAQTTTVTPPVVPDNLQVPAPNEAFLVGHAVGTQNYTCLPSSSVGHVAWTLFTPEATLFGEQKEQLITHYFSPNPFENGTTIRATWQDSGDASTVWGRVNASSSDPNFVRRGAIPWVLVQVVGAEAGPTGGDTLSKTTTFIQRVNTFGGSAPPTGCDLPTDIGNKAFMPYTADYVFYELPASTSTAPGRN